MTVNIVVEVIAKYKKLHSTHTFHNWRMSYHRKSVISMCIKLWKISSSFFPFRVSHTLYIFVHELHVVVERYGVFQKWKKYSLQQLKWGETAARKIHSKTGKNWIKLSLFLDTFLGVIFRKIRSRWWAKGQMSTNSVSETVVFAFLIWK